MNGFNDNKDELPTGICPECGLPNGDFLNGLCEFCLSYEEIKCPSCLLPYPRRDITNHGICPTCLDERAEEFTQRLKEKLNQ